MSASTFTSPLSLESTAPTPAKRDLSKLSKLFKTIPQASKNQIHDYYCRTPRPESKSISLVAGTLILELNDLVYPLQQKGYSSSAYQELNDKIKETNAALREIKLTGDATKEQIQLLEQARNFSNESKAVNGLLDNVISLVSIVQRTLNEREKTDFNFVLDAWEDSQEAQHRKREAEEAKKRAKKAASTESKQDKQKSVSRSTKHTLFSSRAFI